MVEVTLRCDERDEVPRIAGLTQLVDQFNLTSRRYSEADIAGWMALGYVYSIHVEGEIEGVVIIECGRVDTFLLSDRILGRGIEYAIWGPILDTMREIGWKWIVAQYVSTPRNEIVKDFWRNLGFEPRIGGEWAHWLPTLSIPRPPGITVTRV